MCVCVWGGGGRKIIFVCSLLKILSRELSIKSKFYLYSSLRHLLWCRIYIFVTCLETKHNTHDTCLPRSCMDAQKVLYQASSALES